MPHLRRVLPGHKAQRPGEWPRRWRGEEGAPQRRKSGLQLPPGDIVVARGFHPPPPAAHGRWARWEAVLRAGAGWLGGMAHAVTVHAGVATSVVVAAVAHAWVFALAVEGHGRIKRFLLRGIQAGVEGGGGTFALFSGGCALLAQGLGLFDALGRGQLAPGFAVGALGFACGGAGALHVFLPSTFLGCSQLQQGLDALHMAGMQG